MVFTTNIKALGYNFIWLLLISSQVNADYFTGLPTHDQNPLLTPYWIPHTIGQSNSEQLQFSSLLSISNTLQIEDKKNEQLILDSETYRLDFNFQYEKYGWLFYAQLPILSSSAGFLDSLIVDWHDFFQLPQGERLEQKDDQQRYQYSINGNEVINQQSSFNALGDLSIAAVYPVYSSAKGIFNLGFGVNLPIQSSNNLISNDAIDSAIWISYLSKNQQNLAYFYTLGNSQIGKGGALKGLLKSNLWFAQTGMKISLSPRYDLLLQLDYHSSLLKNTATDSLGNSLQMQLGLSFIKLGPNTQLSLFFSEDIAVSTAPDITFAALLKVGF